jgi:hypothetical protein
MPAQARGRKEARSRACLGRGPGCAAAQRPPGGPVSKQMPSHFGSPHPDLLLPHWVGSASTNPSAPDGCRGSISAARSQAHARAYPRPKGGARSHLPLRSSLAPDHAPVGDGTGTNVCQLGRPQLPGLGARRAPLRGERRQFERPQELNFVLELDPVGHVCSAPSLCHQGDRIHGPGAVGVLDEVRVPR